MTRVVFSEEVETRTKKIATPNGMAGVVINKSHGLIKTKAGANMFLFFVIIICFVLTAIFWEDAKKAAPTNPEPFLIDAVQPTTPL